MEQESSNKILESTQNEQNKGKEADISSDEDGTVQSDEEIREVKVKDENNIQPFNEDELTDVYVIVDTFEEYNILGYVSLREDAEKVLIKLSNEFADKLQKDNMMSTVYVEKMTSSHYMVSQKYGIWVVAYERQVGSYEYFKVSCLL